MKIKSKLIISFGLMSFIALVIVSVMTYLLYHSILDERKLKIKSLVEMTHSIIVKWDNVQKVQHIPLALAQKSALNEIQNIRYDKTNYFWVNDFNATIILHPIKTELNGQDGSTMQDSNGKAIFVEFAKVGKSAEGEGYVDYYWDKSNKKNDPAAKTSYVKAYKPWGWVVGSGLYIDDIMTTTIHETIQMLTVFGVGGITIGYVLYHLILNITKKVFIFNKIFSKIEDKDISVKYNSKNPNDPDELNILGLHFNTMLQSLKDLLAKLTDSSHVLYDNAESLAATGNQINNSIQSQNASTQNISSTIEQLSVSISSINDNLFADTRTN